MSNKVLARALVKLALAEDRQIAINTADSAQFCGNISCSELSDEETKEINRWVSLKVDEQIEISDEAKE